MPKSVRDQVFISYSHSDSEWLARLRIHLTPYVRGRSVSVWDDTMIAAGDDWRGQIEVALAVAKVAVLLVSHHFLASDFIHKEELPPLLDAARQEGLIVLPVVVGACSIEETELRVYQAANDPNNPLEALSPGDLNKQFVNICKKIKAAANKKITPSRSEAARPVARGRRLGLALHKLCDRTTQLSQFDAFFESNLVARPGVPQVYLIRGRLSECPDSLIDRLIADRIKSYEKRTKDLLKSGAPKLKPFGWVAHPGELEEQKRQLTSALFQEFAPAHAGADVSARALSASPKLAKYRFVFIQHDIYLMKWRERDAELLDWYINTYWADLNAGASGPQFIIFISFIYPEEPNSWLGSWIESNDFDEQHFDKFMQNISVQPPRGCPRLLFSPLSPPQYTELYEWYRSHQIYDSVLMRMRRSGEIFAKYEKQITMAVIEEELRQDL